MKLRARTWGCAIAVLVTATACNAILGIGELSAPDLPDAVAADGSSDVVSTSDASSDASDGGCGDPCAVIEPQTSGAIFPTWLITSDLVIQNVNVSVVNPRLPAYVDAGAGTARESTSGLTWQTAYAPDAGEVDYAGAVAACQGLGAGWRLPTRIEIATTQYRAEVLTADAGTTTSCVPPVFDPTPAYAWTSTPVPVGDAGAELYIADEARCAFLSGTPDAVFNVRCVKGDTKPATFNVSVSKGIVHAVDTDLDWERTGTLIQTYAQAKSHCDSIGWRIPIIQELYGIIDTRTPGLTDPRLFVSAGSVPRGILSQTLLAVAPDGTPSYSLVSFVEGARGHEDAMQLDDGIADVLLRCVRQHVP